MESFQWFEKKARQFPYEQYIEERFGFRLFDISKQSDNSLGVWFVDKRKLIVYTKMHLTNSLVEFIHGNDFGATILTAIEEPFLEFLQQSDKCPLSFALFGKIDVYPDLPF